MSKNKDKKKKEREKRVAQKKLADAAKRREVAKLNEESGARIPRSRKVMTAGVKQIAKPQGNTSKPTVAHRRTGG